MVRYGLRGVCVTSTLACGAHLDAKYLGKNGGKLGGNGNNMLMNGARWARYHHTKLANAVFTMELAGRGGARHRGSDAQLRCCCEVKSSTNRASRTTAAREKIPLAHQLYDSRSP